MCVAFGLKCVVGCNGNVCSDSCVFVLREGAGEGVVLQYNVSPVLRNEIFKLVLFGLCVAWQKEEECYILCCF